MAVRNVASNARVRCFVHGTMIPRAAAHEHHEAPRAAGGGDELENLIWLCATCHQLAHRCCQLLQQAKSGEASDIATQTYGIPEARKRFGQVVREMIEAHGHAELAGLGKENAEVMLELDHELYAYLKGLAADYRDPKGHKIGVAKYIEGVLRKHALVKGWVHKPDQLRVRRTR